MRLLTNNPRTLEDLAEYGLSQIAQVKHVAGVGDSNRRYLAAKRDWGHRITPRDLDPA
jgi:GTP cyclohydrolase II